MLLLFFIISNAIILTVGTPLHKYPFVFLLDVGNEELEKTNSEQIRLSVPGGSIALRYPAVGDGDLMSHVRVSGIDFGIDLKANILDGGPGYKYVVLVFMGNPGVQYDVVLTIQTVPCGNVNNDSVDEEAETETNSNTYKVKEEIEDDVNNDNMDYKGDESTNDISPKRNNKVREVQSEASSEQLQSASSSDIYKYEESNISNKDFDEDDDKDIHKTSYDHDYAELLNNGNSEASQNEQSDYNEPKAEPYSLSEVQNDKGSYVDNNLYNKYEALKPHLYEYEQVYPQKEEQDDQLETSREDDNVEIDQMFNDEEIHNDAQKYRDSNNNNNYFDTDDDFAVAS